MSFTSTVTATSIALLAISASASAFTTVGGCPPGTFQERITYTDSFGPEVGNWTGKILSVPKYVPEPDADLIQVAVQICGQIDGSAKFQNLDDDPCTFTYNVEAAALVTPQDPASPVNDFDLAVSATGGPFALDPGESGSDAFDSGITCDAVQRFTKPTHLAFFTASPGDENLLFDHSGVTSSEHFGCGVLDFSTTIFSELDLSITYVVCRTNYSPTCAIADVGQVACGGATTLVQLDGSGSSDANGTTLTFAWGTNCPNASFDDSTSATPILSIDTSSSCDFTCTVRMRVSDGVNTVGCSEDITVADIPGAPELGGSLVERATMKIARPDGSVLELVTTRDALDDTPFEKRDGDFLRIVEH